MKKVFALLAALISYPVFAQEPTQVVKPPLGFEAFRDICYVNAANGFAGSELAADKYQIKFFTPAPMMVGMTEDKSLSAMIEGKTCSITTESQTDADLGKKFSDWISQLTNQKAPSSFPIKLEVNGKIMIFMHDRNGGEAFVLMAL